MGGSPDRNEAPASPLFESAAKIYPREIAGRFANLSRLSTIVLLGLFYGVPWLSWDGRQAVLFDLPARKFYLFGLTLWPQDFPYLALLLIIAALSLFFFTALAGRLWCGFACPQTVWTEAFIWIEQLTEGTRSKRIKLDRAAWSWDKLRRKGSKQLLWVLFALWTGFTFVGFFTPVRELGTGLLHGDIGGWPLFWTLFYGFATYGNAGYMREQVCKYMCPYARFQSVMFDKDTLVISYDRARGEPRGGRKRSLEHREAGLGDCIDCTLCVQVCPTGIDIRDGLQYECIACAACIDACDSVMDRMNYPRGLVRYTTENALAGKPSRLSRPRVLVYAALLVLLTAGFTLSLLGRTPVILDVIRDRNALFLEVNDGWIENSYTLKLVNQVNAARAFHISADGLEGLTMLGVDSPVTVPGGNVESLPVRVRVPREHAYGIMPITFRVTAVDDENIVSTEDSRFLGPMAR